MQKILLQMNMQLLVEELPVSLILLTNMTNGNYNKTKKYSDVKPGDYIYWTTKSGNRTWHHQGYVKNTYKNRPNHS